MIKYCQVFYEIKCNYYYYYNIVNFSTLLIKHTKKIKKITVNLNNLLKFKNYYINLNEGLEILNMAIYPEKISEKEYNDLLNLKDHYKRNNITVIRFKEILND